MTVTLAHKLAVAVVADKHARKMLSGETNRETQTDYVLTAMEHLTRAYDQDQPGFRWALIKRLAKPRMKTGE